MSSSPPAVELDPLAQVPTGVAFVGPDLLVAEADAAFAALVGRDEPRGLPVAALLPECTPPLCALVEVAVAERHPLLDRAIEGPGGVGRWLLSLYPIVSRAGRLLGVDLVLSGLVGQAPADAATAERLALALSHQRFDLDRAEGPFRAVFEQAEIGIVLTGPCGGLVAANPRFCAMLGYQPEELLRLSPQAVTHPDDQSGDLALIEALVRGEAAPAIEQRYLRKDGAEIWVRVTRSLVRGADGAVQFGLMLVQDVGEAKRLEAALRDSESLLRHAVAGERQALAAADEALALLDTLIESAPIGLAFLDTEFRYLRVNAALARLNQRPTAEHLGRRASELFPQLGPLWERHWREVMRTGEPLVDLELSATKAGSPDAAPLLEGALPTGRECYVLASYYPVRSASGELLGVGMVVQEITERKRVEAERADLLAHATAARAAEEAARARAEEALRLRDAFISVAAHELRTPLTSLIGQARLLERRLVADGLSDQNRRSLDVIISQSRRISELVTDLLDGAHLEAGQLAIRKVRLDLAVLLRRVVDELQPTLSRHRLSCLIEDGPMLVSGDAMRLDQVLLNLLSNAVKYSPRGGAVTMQAVRRGGEVVITVSDEGIGIPSEAIPRLFERFYRAPNADAQHVAGVGVGLYVVKEIVAQHGGSVAVESRLGVGSTFTVALPLWEG